MSPTNACMVLRDLATVCHTVIEIRENEVDVIMKSDDQ
jgi:hypothetical protein